MVSTLENTSVRMTSTGYKFDFSMNSNGMDVLCSETIWPDWVFWHCVSWGMESGVHRLKEDSGKLCGIWEAWCLWSLCHDLIPQLSLFVLSWLSQILLTLEKCWVSNCHWSMGFLQELIKWNLEVRERLFNRSFIDRLGWPLRLLLVTGSLNIRWQEALHIVWSLHQIIYNHFKYYRSQ